MKAEFINPFIQGAESILQAVCNETTVLGKVYLKTKPYQPTLNIKIEIVGELTGTVFYGMDNATACSLASKMMMGMPVEQLDDMSKSALCELSNMISGTIATNFSQIGKQIDITPPQLSSDFDSVSMEKLFCVPITLANNNILELNIWLNE